MKRLLIISVLFFYLTAIAACSKDDESREEAIKILNELAGDRRLVGIISHVTELKEQIDRKLVVAKDEKGSKVYWAE